MEALINNLNTLGAWLHDNLWRMSMELAILAGVVAMALFLLRVKSPAWRHMFWGLVLAKPVFTFLVASPLSLYAFLTPPEAPRYLFSATPASLVTRAPGNLQPRMERPVQDMTSRVNTPPSPPSPSGWEMLDWRGVLALAWLCGAGMLAIRLGGGFLFVALLRDRSERVKEGPLAELVRETAGAMRVRGNVAIGVSDMPHGPVLAGVLHSMILMPRSMAETFTDAQLKQIIAHEMAHVRRWDNLVLVMQRLAEMLLFFHPVVWICGWIMRREAESACDDLAVAALGDSTRYVDSLVRVAEMRCGMTRRLLLNTFAAAESGFVRRARRLLGGRRRMTLWVTLTAACVLGVIGIIGLPAAITKNKTSIINKNDKGNDSIYASTPNAIKQEQKADSLNKETTEESLNLLSEIEFFYFPGSGCDQMWAVYLPLEKNAAPWDVDMIVNNKRFIKLFQDMGDMSNSVASYLINEELKKSLPIYLNLFDTYWSEVKIRAAANLDAAKESPQGGIGFVISNNPDHSPTILGARYKILALLLLAGNLHAQGTEREVLNVFTLALKQRERFYNPEEGHLSDRHGILQKAGLYNRQILTTALLGVRNSDQWGKKDVFMVYEMPIYSTGFTASSLGDTSYAHFQEDEPHGQQMIKVHKPVDDTEFDAIVSGAE